MHSCHDPNKFSKESKHGTDRSPPLPGHVRQKPCVRDWTIAGTSARRWSKKKQAERKEYKTDSHAILGAFGPLFI